MRLKTSMGMGVFLLAAMLCLGCVPAHADDTLKAIDGVSPPYPNAAQQDVKARTISIPLDRKVKFAAFKVWTGELFDQADIGVVLYSFFKNSSIRSIHGDRRAVTAVVDGEPLDSAALHKAFKGIGRVTQIASGGNRVIFNERVPIQVINNSTNIFVELEYTVAPLSRGFVRWPLKKGQTLVLLTTENFSANRQGIGRGPKKFMLITVSPDL
jgi:hypothetical protein